MGSQCVCQDRTMDNRARSYFISFHYFNTMRGQNGNSGNFQPRSNSNPCWNREQPVAGGELGKTVSGGTGDFDGVGGSTFVGVEIALAPHMTALVLAVTEKAVRIIRVSGPVVLLTGRVGCKLQLAKLYFDIY